MQRLYLKFIREHLESNTHIGAIHPQLAEVVVFLHFKDKKIRKE